MAGRICAVCMSAARGTPKSVVPWAELIAEHGISGDAHAGGWHRQISILPLEAIEDFRRTGVEAPYGVFGENLVVSGLAWDGLVLGDRIACGEALLEITQFGKECHTRCAIFEAVGDCVMPRRGVFARIVRGGRIVVGDTIAVVGERCHA